MATSTDTHLTEGYKHSLPFDSGILSVGSIHRLHYEQYGNARGKPVIYLHGGPGSGTSIRSTIFFDPAIYRVVLLDQRGAGKSEPVAELRENTSEHLVSDIETLREHLGIDNWHMVFGGSWGSTLSLLYAQTHPDRVDAIVIFGIFTLLKAEIKFQKGFDGAARIFPELFEEFMNYLPPKDRSDIPAGYHKLLTSDDYETRLAASRAWNKWELGIINLIPTEESFELLRDDRWNLQHAILESHYETNGAFIEEGQLLKPENIAKIRHIPCEIVQGRYDIDCPPKAAWDLHKALPDSKLYMIPDAGHSVKEPGIQRKLIEICDEYRSL